MKDESNKTIVLSAATGSKRVMGAIRKLLGASNDLEEMS